MRLTYTPRVAAEVRSPGHDFRHNLAEVLAERVKMRHPSAGFHPPPPHRAGKRCQSPVVARDAMLRSRLTRPVRGYLSGSSLGNPEPGINQKELAGRLRRAGPQPPCGVGDIFRADHRIQGGA
jgi:hypothetical protein